MLSCSKTYRDIPLGHRQPFHPGHCSRIHGHNWAIRLTFAAKETDQNGFVVDFGDLKYIKTWIDENLDHACAISSKDPHLARMEKWNEEGLIQLLVIPDASCEGLAKHLFQTFDPMVRDRTRGRAWISSIELHEDSKNSATYAP
jgi:6-pyruvoyltetrahydropterin/6-carboxytetrahydropterin synthase